MRVHIRYFGRFAADIGKFSEDIEFDDKATVKELVEFLKRKYPFLKDELVEVSINGKYAKDDDPLASEVSVFPVISGG